MMVISMELKARVARFSPKRIAKAFAGRFSDSVAISNIGILELFFQGQHLGALPDFIDQVKPKSQGRQPCLTSSSCSNMLPLWNPLKPPKCRTLFGQLLVMFRIRIHMSGNAKYFSDLLGR